MTTKSMVKFVATIAAGMILTVSTVRADQQVSFGFDMPVELKLKVNSGDCDNSPGPFVTLEGVLAVGGINAELIFQNNVKGTHKATVTTSSSAVLLNAGESITIPKQPVLGGVGGNPWIYIQFYNDAGNLSPEILLGRCVQGLEISQGLLNGALATALISGSDCSNNPGPWITLQGAVELNGVNARIIFKNNVKGTHKNVQTVEIELLPSGTTIVIPKQPVRGGVGGNPWIWVQFLQDSGVPIGSPYFLGRCSQL